MPSMAWRRGPSSAHLLQVNRQVISAGGGRKGPERLRAGGPTGRGPYLGGDGKDALAADPDAPLLPLQGLGPLGTWQSW